MEQKILKIIKAYTPSLKRVRMELSLENEQKRMAKEIMLTIKEEEKGVIDNTCQCSSVDTTDVGLNKPGQFYHVLCGKIIRNLEVKDKPGYSKKLEGSLERNTLKGTMSAHEVIDNLITNLRNFGLSLEDINNAFNNIKK